MMCKPKLQSSENSLSGSCSKFELFASLSYWKSCIHARSGLFFKAMLFWFQMYQLRELCHL
uniref:Uncharacterized protein n=1 Tax=Anguilla anguilla TaxID=7936 RepID=A0A0E9W6E3_ANGAN